MESSQQSNKQLWHLNFAPKFNVTLAPTAAHTKRTRVLAIDFQLLTKTTTYEMVATLFRAEHRIHRSSPRPRWACPKCVFWYAIATKNQTAANIASCTPRTLQDQTHSWLRAARLPSTPISSISPVRRGKPGRNAITAEARFTRQIENQTEAIARCIVRHQPHRFMEVKTLSAVSGPRYSREGLDNSSIRGKIAVVPATKKNICT